MLVAALISPLDQLGGTLLLAHMAQLGLLVAVAPPLLLLGQPGAAPAWALQMGWSKGGFVATVWRHLARFGRALSRPPAVILHGLALWDWHAPVLFDAAIEHEWLHRLEHIAFLGTGLLFWRAVLEARAGRRVGPALGAAFATLTHGGFLGALITLAPFPLYDWYVDRAEFWGVTALGDHQLAGRLVAPRTRRDVQVARMGSIFVAQVPLQVGSP
ncbi:MAG: putative rane protein [Rhodospirillales bacterium]|nr:putative rane protein [Rhodospirillales bacterium]